MHSHIYFQLQQHSCLLLFQTDLTSNNNLFFSLFLYLFASNAPSLLHFNKMYSMTASPPPAQSPLSHNVPSFTVLHMYVLSFLPRCSMLVEYPLLNLLSSLCAGPGYWHPQAPISNRPLVAFWVNKPLLNTRNVEQTKYVLCTLKNLF